MRDLGFDDTELMTLAFLLFVAALFFVALSCAPRTDLYVEATTPGTDPGGGSAAGALVDPPAGTDRLPRNLAALAVRLPAAIAIDTAVFRLRPSEGGAAVALGSPGGVACGPAGLGGAGSCYRIPIAGLLDPGRGYLLELLSATLAAEGAGAGVADRVAAPAGVIGGFDSGDAVDDAPPQVVDFTVSLAGPCAGVRFSTDEPVSAEVILRAGASEAVALAGLGLDAFDLAAPFRGLEPGTRADIVLRLTDRAGNQSDASAGSFDVPPETPPLAITEVLANPAGTEPGQEFVELRNLGDTDLALGGLRLEDAKGVDLLPEATLSPGGYALVVPSSFDPQSSRDTPPRPGTLMVPVDARLGSDGLSNAGEVVRLRLPGSATEPIVSSYGGWVDVSAASAAGKSVHRLTDGACDHPTAWTRPPRAATPGWGTP
jgi:hypothetical protein